jgi:phosphatidylserine decarboxylase
MVGDGYYYGAVLLLSAGFVAWLTSPLWAILPVALAVLFLWFFRDPERVIPSDSHAVVSPADGKVTEVSNVDLEGRTWKRVSIFLNVFNVHVNRSPVSGVIRSVGYQPGKFLNAMNPSCAECNEQNTVTIEHDGERVLFKQIAGLLARRIVFTKKVGDKVERGERVGLIKFGSRTDVFLARDAQISVRVGDHVKGGSSILGFLKADARELELARGSGQRGRAQP